MSAPNMEVIRSERFGQANTCSEKNALVKGKGRYIRTKQGELQMMINFDLHVPKLRSNCFFFFKEFLFFSPRIELSHQLIQGHGLYCSEWNSAISFLASAQAANI